MKSTSISIATSRLSTRRGTSAWEVIARLHGFHGNMPGSAFVSTWGWYTELCTFAVLFAGVSGVFLWTQRKNERRIGFVLLGGAGVCSIGADGLPHAARMRR